MDYRELPDQFALRLAVSGQITYNDQVSIRKLFNVIRKSPLNRVIIDLSSLTFIDSAGIGMILILVDELSFNGKVLEFENLQGQVARVFTITKVMDLLLMSRLEPPPQGFPSYPDHPAFL